MEANLDPLGKHPCFQYFALSGRTLHLIPFPGQIPPQILITIILKPQTAFQPAAHAVD